MLAPIRACARPPKVVIECLRSVLHVLDHALHQVPQRAVVDYVLNADPPAGVRMSSSTIGVDRGLPHLCTGLLIKR